MSAGFRKSLFGFNCDDVMSYIQTTHKSYTEKETVLNERLEELGQTLSKANSELNAFKDANIRLERELKEYTDKYDEIERLSQNIGKLYLVAQANARAVMDNSAKAEEISRNEAQKNISVLSEAHKSLDELRSNILKTSTDFALQVEQLLSSLDSAKESISECTTESRELTQEFESLYAGLAK